MSRAPVVAPAVIVMLAVSEVALLKVVELTVIPAPENATVAPDTNPVPVIVMFWLVAPWARELGLVEDTLGPVFTVNTPVPVPAPASGFVTVRSPAPVLAPAATVMLAVSDVPLTNVTEFTVIPAAENATVAPDTNPVPVIVMFWLVAPWPRDAGLVDVTVGAALTVNRPVPVAVLPSPLVMVTFRAPVAAAAEIETLTLNEVALTKVTELTVIPVPENEAARAAPLSKLVPVIVIVWLLAPCPRELGLVEVTAGAGLTVNRDVPVATSPSGLVTETLRDPVAALPEIVMLAVSEVELTKLTEFTVMPEPENPTVAPETKLVPVIVIVWLVAPWSYDPGATEVTVGG
jgi:hypothetical protein